MSPDKASLSLTPLLAVFLMSCGTDERVAGNGTYVGNGVSAGRAVLPSGEPVPNAWVECLPLDWEPWDDREKGWTSLTDSVGRWRCSELPEGAIGVTVYDPGSGLLRWHRELVVVGGLPGDRIDTLAAAGRLRIALPPHESGLLRFEGLSRAVAVRGEEEILVEGLPAGWRGRVFLSTSTRTSRLIDSSPTVRSGALDSVGYSRGTSLFRVPLAGGLTSVLEHVPVLVRVDSAWPGFTGALPDGSDLRLSTTTGQDLPLTLASWDPVRRLASFWTVLDSLQPPGDSVDVRLSWGLPMATPSRRGAFDVSRGWVAAWPLGDTGLVAQDRLGGHSGSAVGVRSVNGPIALASRFDGERSIVRIAGSRTGALDPAEGIATTITCWARLDRYVDHLGQVAGRGEFGGRLYYKHRHGNADSNLWMVKDHRGTTSGGAPYHLAKADTSAWTHLAMTVDGDSVALFVNGVRQTRMTGYDKSPVGRRATDFTIGAALDTTGALDAPFPGDLAEVWFQSVARSPDWIRLVAANQSPTAAKARRIPTP